MVASAGPRAASRASFERAPTGPPPEEWRDGIRTSRGRAHAAPFHAGPRLGRGAVAQGRVQPLPVVLVDVLFSERRDMAAAEAFFRSAKAVTGVTPDRVTTDGHDSYPRAIRSELGKGVRHRTSRYLNNRLEQDHRGLKGRYRPMRGFKCP